MRIAHSKPKENDIWICKQLNKNAFGENISIAKPIYLFVISEIDNLDDEDFVRVQPISTNIESICDDDILIDDTTILGASFIIETWNEQPVLVDIFDKKLGEISFELPEVKPQEKYTKQQLVFRANEIKRTAYLRQSILSSLAKQDVDYIHARKITTYKALSIAASFIGIGLFAWQPGRMSNSDFCNKYSDTYDMSFNYESAGGVLSRGNYYLLPNFTVEESITIQDGLTAYNSNEFDRAITLLSTINGLESKSPEVLFYLGLSQLQADSPKEAISTFEQLLKHDNAIFYGDMLYNLAIAYVKNGNTVKARRTIKQLKKHDSSYLIEHEDILKDLRLF
jgi:tetratricopeptide (TPR) repeat protein